MFTFPAMSTGRHCSVSPSAIDACVWNTLWRQSDGQGWVWESGREGGESHSQTRWDPCPYCIYLYDITDWCKENLHTLRWRATDRAEWQRVVKHAIDTNGWTRPWSRRWRRYASGPISTCVYVFMFAACVFFFIFFSAVATAANKDVYTGWPKKK